MNLPSLRGPLFTPFPARLAKSVNKLIEFADLANGCFSSTFFSLHFLL